jgi:hypothetical protein
MVQGPGRLPKTNDSDGIANATGTESELFNKRNSSGEPQLVDIVLALSYCTSH